MRKFRTWLANGVLLGVSLYLGALAVDAFVYMQYLRSGVRHPQGLYVVDEERGYALAPGFQGTITNSVEHAYQVTINSQGYRGPEWDLSRPNRILVAGDSFTFGTPLPLEKGYVAKADALAGDKATFINVGVPGYGVASILPSIAQECPKVQPRHVFYMYYHNDSNWGGVRTDSRTVVDGYLVWRLVDRGARRLSREEIRGKLKQKLEEGHRSWHPTATLRLLYLREFLSQRGVHPRQVIERWVRDEGERFSDDYLSRYMQTTDQDAYPPEATDRAVQMIRQMDREARTCGAEGFTMVILPSYSEAYYGVREPVTDEIRSRVMAAGVDVMDLRFRSLPEVDLTLPGDGHYRELGTGWVARQIWEDVQRRYPELRESPDG